MKQKTSMKKIRNLLNVLLLAGGCSLLQVPAQAAERTLLDRGWLFSLGDEPLTERWTPVDLPHDWSIASAPVPDAPAGGDGGYRATGIGWYKKRISIPLEEMDKELALYFEGVYMNSEVYVNGTKVGGHPYGYSSFRVDITPYVRFGETDTITVRVDNAQQKNCRWYSGSGIYRHVWLESKEPVSFEPQGIRLTTVKERGKTFVQAIVAMHNPTDKKQEVELTYSLDSVGTKKTKWVLGPQSSTQTALLMEVKKPHLWSPDHPYLYTAHLTLAQKGRTLDAESIPVGIREITYSAADGLKLNGNPIVLNGGCVHHDNGVLGAAAFDKAEVRKVRLLKEAGFNAVRTSHNPPSPAFLNACDSLGLLVIDEAFDGWYQAKNPHDYSTLIDEWWANDLRGMVERDRNHPSVFCWSIGNEILERKSRKAVETARKMADLCHSLDPTRPVTQALASWDADWEIYDSLAAQHDIVGYNYMIHKADGDHERVPSRVMMQTESYPKDAYSNWRTATEKPYVIGDFVWTAIDYLGESGIGRYYYKGDTPGEHWEHPLYPWNGAYCGDIDLTGWRKPISHYRSMLYHPDGEKLYMAVREPNGYFGDSIRTTLWAVHPTWESWTWPGFEDKLMDVEVYSRYPQVRMSLNGKVLVTLPCGEEHKFRAVLRIPYTEGTLVAEGMQDGKAMESVVLRTAGPAKDIRLTADSRKIEEDGMDLVYVTVEVVDEMGTVVPNDSTRLQFEVSGGGTLIAVGNGDVKDTDPYVADNRRAWKGRAIAVVRSNGTHQAVRLLVRGDGLKSRSIVF